MLRLAIAAVVVVAGLAAARVVVPAVADRLPSGNRAAFVRRLQAATARPLPAARPITDADLAKLPPPVRGYLVRAGVVGRPRVRRLDIRFHGAIRESATSPWMPFDGVQHTDVAAPERLFFMRASRLGVPVDVFHAFRADEASMRVRLASLVTLADVSGPTLVRSETVTFLNDLCVFAPAALVDAPIAWEPIDGRSARARYTLGAQAISAVLSFDAAGDLVDFRSEDRYQDAGGADRPLPWTTPLSQFAAFTNGIRLPRHGEGWWHPPEGAFAYLRIEVDDVVYDDEARQAPWP